MAFLKLLDFIVKISMWLNIMQVQTTWNSVYICFEKGRRKKMCTRQSRKIIWDIINTLFFWHCSCRTYFCCFSLALANILPWSLVHDSNFFEKQWTQNRPHNLSGLSHALFPTSFLEIAVNKKRSTSVTRANNQPLELHYKNTGPLSYSKSKRWSGSNCL